MAQPTAHDPYCGISNHPNFSFLLVMQQGGTSLSSLLGCIMSDDDRGVVDIRSPVSGDGII